MPFTSKQELLTLNAGDFEKSFKSGDIDIVGLVSEVIRQIKNENKDGLNLKALISMAPESKLIERAKQLDRERLEGHSRGPLHGIPIVLKVWMDWRIFLTFPNPVI
jgi:amidase